MAMTAKLGRLSEFSSMESQVWIEKMGHMGDVGTFKKICTYSLDYIGFNLTVYRAWVRLNKEEKLREKHTQGEFCYIDMIF